jgi:hypothetical protein
MKKIVLLIVTAVIMTTAIHAQRVELTPFGGYVFGGTMNTDGGNIYFNGNGQYGGMISVRVSRVVDVDLIYNRSDTKGVINNSYWVISTKDVPLSINYIHIGFTKNFRVNPTVSPFLGFNAGTCIFAPKQDYSDTWLFSMGLIGGAKVYLSNRIGLRFQAQLLMPIQGAGFNVFVGSGGASTGVSTYSTLAQFGFNGGLIFRLGRIMK